MLLTGTLFSITLIFAMNQTPYLINTLMVFTVIF